MRAKRCSAANRDTPEALVLRRLQIVSSRLASSIFSGEYRSAFRGRGIEFDEVREYEAGDDISSIDWNVTARQGHPFVKRFIEERELTLILLLDCSASMDFGTVRCTKRETANEACALLAFAALRSRDKMALLTFGNGGICYLPPKKGKNRAMQLIKSTVTTVAAPGRASGLAEALDHLRRVATGRSLVFIFSDFIDSLPLRPLAAVAAKHDVVTVIVNDPIERKLPAAGLLRLADTESGMEQLVDSDNPAVRNSYLVHAQQRHDALREAIASSGAALFELDTGTPPFYSLARFFLNRQLTGSR
jgi:uncharacterized protein (DUF58 family)